MTESKSGRQGGDGRKLHGFKAISGDVESSRVLKLHFDHEVTDEDRRELVDAINSYIAATRDAAEGAFPVGEDTPYWRTLRAALVLPVEDQHKIATDLAANCGYELTGDAYAAPPKPAPAAMREALVREVSVLLARHDHRYGMGGTQETEYAFARAHAFADRAIEVVNLVAAFSSLPAAVLDREALIEEARRSKHYNPTDPMQHAWNAGLDDRIAALRAAPVPPADVAGETDAEIADRLEQTYKACGDRWFKLAADRLRRLPSGTGAAEPPPVRGDREALLKYLDIFLHPNPNVDLSGVVCKHGLAIEACPSRECSNPMAYETAIKRARDYIAVLPVQPGAGERETIILECADACEGVAKAFRFSYGGSTHLSSAVDRATEAVRALSRQAPHSSREGGR